MDGVSREAIFAVAHAPQLRLAGVPDIYWPRLGKKLEEQIFDSGETFALLAVDYGDEIRQSHEPLWSVQIIRENGVSAADPGQIYLVDHAWTFKVQQARSQLRQMPALMQRMSNLVGADIDSNTGDDPVEFVFDNIWKYAQTYSLHTDNITPEDSVPIWYIMDELGSGIQHADEPNFRCVPFIYLPDQTTYSLLFPIKNCKEGDIVTRNYIEAPTENENQRQALLLPWQPMEDYDESYSQDEPDSEYFLSGHIEETLPNENHTMIPRDRSTKLKVFSEYARINENLTHPAFEIVNDEDLADVLWYTKHFKSYRELSESFPNKYINQFPFENVITIKDLLSAVGRRISDDNLENELRDNPAWLPKTFNLKTELVKFISYYRQREFRGLDNHWICKPFNLARGLDTYISNNINFIVHLPLTGPKIAQKYIERPLLFSRPGCEGRVKFDVRYVILLTSVQPLKVYAYTNFFLRFANKAFALNNFDEYEQHFTVMNYNNNATLFRMLCADFITEWGKQYPDYTWESVEKDIFKMLRELFECAVSKPAPCGIAPSKQSRALYAADIMLAWDKDSRGNEIVQPKLLEMNWMPDCNRACEYYPDFYNDIFSLMFLDEETPTCRELLPA